jgi:hypothetical protein
VTRAKRHVCVICNVDCVSTDPVLKSFAEYLTTHADVRTATQYDHLRVDIVRPQGMELTLQDSAPKKSDAKKTSQKSDAKRVDKKSKAASTKKTEVESTKRETGDKKIEVSAKPELAETERREELFKMVQNFADSKTENVFR